MYFKLLCYIPLCYISWGDSMILISFLSSCDALLLNKNENYLLFSHQNMGKVMKWLLLWLCHITQLSTLADKARDSPTGLEELNCHTVRERTTGGRGSRPCGEELKISRTSAIFREKMGTSALAPLGDRFYQQLHELGGRSQAFKIYSYFIFMSFIVLFIVHFSYIISICFFFQ